MGMKIATEALLRLTVGSSVSASPLFRPTTIAPPYPGPCAAAESAAARAGSAAQASRRTPSRSNACTLRVYGCLERSTIQPATLVSFNGRATSDVCGAYPPGVQACPECDRENPDGFVHCGYCAASLAAPRA